MLQQVMNGKPTGQQVEKALTVLGAKKEGDVIEHEVFEQLWGVGRCSDRYRTLLCATRRRMFREQSVMLLSERGIGYRFPTGMEQMKNGVSRIRGGVKRIGSGVRTVSVVSDARLPDSNERRARDFIATQARYLYELGRTHRKTLEMTVGKPEVNPQAV